MRILRRLLAVIAVLVLLAALPVGGWFWWQYRQRHPVIQQVPRQGGLNATLWVLSDLHFGSQVRGRDAGEKSAWIDAMPVRNENLSAGPDADGLDWLNHDLAATGCERPVILYMHYPLLGPWSKSWFGWNTPVTERFGEIVAKFNIVAILHGHFHVPGRYQWRGIDVYNIGSIQHGARCFGVIQVTDTTFTYGSWNAELKNWWWWHSKTINGTGRAATTAGEISGVAPSHGLLTTLAIPYPVKAE